MIRLRFIAAAVPVVVPAMVPFAVPAPVLAAPVPATVVAHTLTDDAAALTYEFVGTVVSDAAGKSHEQVMMHGRATALGDRVRIDIDDAGSANSYMRGAYLLILDGGRRVVWVNPLSRQYREADPESIMGGLDALTDGSNGMISMEASNVSIDAEKVGAGPTIQGHNTVHYRLWQRMNMKTKVFFKTVVTHDESTTDYYYATDFPAVINPFIPSAPSLPRAGSLLGDEYTRQLRTAVDKLYKGGTPLRTIVNTKSTDEAGRAHTTMTTTDVSNVTRRDVSTAVFEIPAGYVRTTASPVLGNGVTEEVPDGVASALLGEAVAQCATALQHDVFQN